MTAGGTPSAGGRASLPAPSLGAVGLALVAGVFLLALAYMPLGPELWGHLAYGGWIVEHRGLPAADPFLPLAEGMPVARDGWLAQAALAAAERLAGLESVAVLLALVALATVWFLGRALWRASGSWPATLAGLALALALCWPRLTAFGPARFGLLCFALLLWLLADGERGSPAEAVARPVHGGALWLGVPLLFAAWVNLDGSFVYGLAVMACLVAGRALEIGWKTRRPRAVAGDLELRRRLWLAELALAATLLNPRGIDWLAEILAGTAVGASGGGGPLSFRGLGGWAFAASLAVLLLALRHSRRPVTAAATLLLALFGVWAATRAAAVAAWGPVLALVLAPHLAELLPVRRPLSAAEASSAGGGPRWLMLAGLAWIVFALSPVGSPLLGVPRRGERQLAGGALPERLATELRANPPGGVLLAPADWSGWLLRRGPAGLQPFVAGAPAVLPRRVWADFGEVLATSGRWQWILDRYRVVAVAVDKERSPRLAITLRGAEGWVATHEDPKALLFSRLPRDPAAAARLHAGHTHSHATEPAATPLAETPAEETP